MSPRNVMSIDVEEWYHPEAVRKAVPIEVWPGQPSRVVREVERILEMLDDAGVRATFFVLGLVAKDHPELVLRIADAGHEVASHGYGHQMITDLDPESFRKDLSEAKKLLEDAAGAEVLGYRAPTFSVVERTLWALDVIAETGHRYDASVYPIHHDRYGIPTAPRFPYRHDNGLIELPGSTVRIPGVMNFPVGGGGYLRLLPLGFNLAALHYINKVEGRPFVVYFHPWETDPEQPRLKLPFPRVHRHYAFIDQMLGRLRRLCATFPFATAEAVLREQGLFDDA